MMPRRKVHYSGGVRCPWAKGFTVRLSGWPACVSGDKAERIATSGNQSDDTADVTCPRCQRLIAAQAEYRKASGFKETK
jgi:hypothetical protein